MYIDMDSIVLAPLQEFWDIRLKMNASQMVAATHNEAAVSGSGYKPGYNVPFVPPAGRISVALLRYCKLIVIQQFILQ